MLHRFSLGTCRALMRVNCVLHAPASSRVPSAVAMIVLAHSGTAQVCFEASAPNKLGLYTNYVISAELDADGDMDLVAADASKNVVSVLLNRGDGTFAPYVHYVVGTNASNIASADFNGDGYNDLAVVRPIARTVSVLLNNGNGTFGTSAPYDVASGPLGLASADLDGDGDIDLVTSNLVSGTVSVLLNQGQGRFAPHVQYIAGGTPKFVTSVDVDVDGDMDLAVANDFPGRVSVLLNQGNGTFAAPEAHSVAGFVWNLTSADLNGDGLTDFVTTHEGLNCVSVLLAQGAGAFAAHVKYPVGSHPHFVTGVDLDDDGDMDLAVPSVASHTVSLLLNRGDGTFAPYQEFSAGVAPVGTASADFDGDGDNDLAVANHTFGSVTVHRNCLEEGITFCSGDGSLLAPCPCAPPDAVPTYPAAPGHGCASSMYFGALLSADGTVAPQPGTLAFRAHIAPNYLGFAYLVKGSASVTSGIAAGDGIRCVDGGLVRFGAHNAGTNGAPMGAWSYPNSVQTVAVATATAQLPGQVAYYQLHYRNAAVNFCNPSTTNWSNGYRVTW